jgi:hypothetical protein
MSESGQLKSVHRVLNVAAIRCGDHRQCGSAFTTCRFALSSTSSRGLCAARRRRAFNVIARSLEYRGKPSVLRPSSRLIVAGDLLLGLLALFHLTTLHGDEVLQF